MTTYREGAYVVDAMTAELAMVVRPSGALVVLQRPGTDRRWEADPDALRLATRDERERAGLSSNGMGVTE
ncbi:hypothetical protein [Streptomyces sp. RKAG293]|uniref:hypothetical protein n=1 Tax=Streptomyces sp. RKAG293 TaxID=2893403 RepID=UPI0020344290|nr:hypothetical protein [Streptomyces sp. RKAG293]MCM2419748.1 hypothetical protein [Streptomyces sp. RKAG293]